MTHITREMVLNAYVFAREAGGDLHYNMARALNADLAGRSEAKVTVLDDRDAHNAKVDRDFFWWLLIAGMLTFAGAVLALFNGDEGWALGFGLGATAMIALGLRNAP